MPCTMVFILSDPVPLKRGSFGAFGCLLGQSDVAFMEYRMRPLEEKEVHESTFDRAGDWSDDPRRLRARLHFSPSELASGDVALDQRRKGDGRDRKSTRLNSS